MAHDSEELPFSYLQIDVPYCFNISTLRATQKFEAASATALVGLGKRHYSNTVTRLIFPLSFFDTPFLFDGSIFANTQIRTRFEAKISLLNFGVLLYQCLPRAGFAPIGWLYEEVPWLGGASVLREYVIEIEG